MTRPRDLDRATERELAEGFAAHRTVLVNAALRIGPQQAIVRVRASALESLAIGEQLIRRMQNARWLIAAQLAAA